MMELTVVASIAIGLTFFLFVWTAWSIQLNQELTIRSLHRFIEKKTDSFTIFHIFDRVDVETSDTFFIVNSRRYGKCRIQEKYLRAIVEGGRFTPIREECRYIYADLINEIKKSNSKKV